MHIVRKDENSGISVVQIGKYFYVVRMRNGQVNSVMCSDMPSDGGTWFASATESGVKYVASGRSRAAAVAGYRRAVAESNIDSEMLV